MRACTTPFVLHMQVVQMVSSEFCETITSAIIIMKNKTAMKVYWREFDTGCHFIKKIPFNILGDTDFGPKYVICPWESSLLLPQDDVPDV